MAWTDKAIESTLRGEIERLGRFPKHSEITTKGLSSAIQGTGGFKRWLSVIGVSHSRSSPITKEELEALVREKVSDLGRMPTFKEAGNSLGCRIVRSGGFRSWAKKLGVSLKESETKRGQDAEDEEEEFLKGLGLTVVRQTTRAPFDMLVNGKRVDVKAAVWTETLRKSGVLKGKFVRGFVFAGIKRGKNADFFLLVCKGKTRRRFLVPAEAARVQTITITTSTLYGHGKYSAFEDAFDPL